MHKFCYITYALMDNKDSTTLWSWKFVRFFNKLIVLFLILRYFYRLQRDFLWLLQHLGVMDLEPFHESQVPFDKVEVLFCNLPTDGKSNKRLFRVAATSVCSGPSFQTYRQNL